jgi:hypothetical protein
MLIFFFLQENVNCWNITSKVLLTLQIPPVHFFLVLAFNPTWHGNVALIKTYLSNNSGGIGRARVGKEC